MPPPFVASEYQINLSLWSIVMPILKSILQRTMKIIVGIFETTRVHHTGAYAAQAAYFFFLSLIPILITLVTIIRFTPITQADIIEAMSYVFPQTVIGFIEGIVGQVFTVSTTIIPISILIIVWSSGRGVAAITQGLNLVYDNMETRNYIWVRFRSMIYTVFFILGIILTLLGSVFGNIIRDSLVSFSPLVKDAVDLLIRLQIVFTFIIMTVFWMFVYRYLPNRGHRYKLTLPRMLPGAIFTSVSWLLLSSSFSLYIRVFTNFQTIYGSLTTVILLLLWLYLCMYLVLLGGELNAFVEKYRESHDLYREKILGTYKEEKNTIHLKELEEATEPHQTES